MNKKAEKLYLSRRNLETLQSKLDRQATGEHTFCTIIKYQQQNSAYKQTMLEIEITAVENHEYYGAQNRPAGLMHPRDEIGLSKPETGVAINDDSINKRKE